MFSGVCHCCCIEVAAGGLPFDAAGDRIEHGRIERALIE
jgi:hypothetical protein